MTNSLPTDTYYRGYRLSYVPRDGVYIYKDAELIDQSSHTLQQAKWTVDSWLNAA